MKRSISISQSELYNIISESISEELLQNNSFSIWKSKFDDYLMEMISQLTDRYLRYFGLNVEIDGSYNFGRKPWLACYEETSGKLENGTMLIAINYQRMYNGMVERGIDKDEFNIEAQARITIGHEIAHGLIDYLVGYCDVESDVVDEFVRDYYNGDIDDEKVTEEFGEMMFPEATGRYSSYLGNVLDNIIES